MDDEDDVRYPHDLDNQNFSLEDGSYNHDVGNKYVDNDDEGEDEDEDDDDDEGDDDEGGNGIQRISKDDYENASEDGDEDDEHGDLQRHPKKRKLKTLLSSYEIVPRIPAQPSGGSSAQKLSYSGRNPLTDWTERETLILLDAWGDKFLKQSRKSLRSEEWQEVAKKVSQESKIERTDTQCRNRLDTLKKRYKKEKMKLVETGRSTSNWICYKKMDMLLSSTPSQAAVPCEVDSREQISTNPKDYQNSMKGLDLIRNCPENSESSEADEDESEDLPPKKTKNNQVKGGADSFKLLADSMQKFVDVYEKIENSKRLQMLELEKMRMDFYKDLELQKMRIQAEMLAKIRQGDYEDNDASAENLSG